MPLLLVFQQLLKLNSIKKMNVLCKKVKIMRKKWLLWLQSTIFLNSNRVEMFVVVFYPRWTGFRFFFVCFFFRIKLIFCFGTCIYRLRLTFWEMKTQSGCKRTLPLKRWYNMCIGAFLSHVFMWNWDKVMAILLSLAGMLYMYIVMIVNGKCIMYMFFFYFIMSKLLFLMYHCISISIELSSVHLFM
jgi:hypothetical protein